MILKKEITEIANSIIADNKNANKFFDLLAEIQVSLGFIPPLQSPMSTNKLTFFGLCSSKNREFDYLVVVLEFDSVTGRQLASIPQCVLL